MIRPLLGSTCCAAVLVLATRAGAQGRFPDVAPSSTTPDRGPSVDQPLASTPETGFGARGPAVGWTRPASPRVAPPRRAWLPHRLPFSPGDPTPPGYRVEESHDTGLAVGGALTLGVSYGAAVILALAGGLDDGDGWLLVPVVGPFAAIGARGDPCTASQPACIDDAVDEGKLIALLMVDGLLQLTGTTLWIVGASSSDRELVRVVPPPPPRFVPRFGPSGAGLDVVGRF